jgi:hypothetical protein
MIVCRAWGFAWFHNPKAAGTTFRHAIRRYHDWPTTFWGYGSHGDRTVDLAHLRTWELAEIAPALCQLLPQMRTVIFVRDPLRRFISACFQHQLVFVGRDFLSWGRDKQHVAIRCIADHLTPATIRSDYRYVHFAPQREFIYLDDRRIVQHIVCVSDIAAGFDALRVPRVPLKSLNRSRPEAFDRLLTKGIVDFVQEFYAADYKMLDELCPGAIEPIPSAPSASFRVNAETAARRMARSALAIARRVTPAMDTEQAK